MMNKIMIFLGAVTLALTLILAAFIVQPYYAYRLSEKLGFQTAGYRTVAHAQTMRALNNLRRDQGIPIDISFYGASTIEGLDIRLFGAGAVNHGYGGWTMKDVLTEWQLAPAKLLGQHIVVLAGFNDLARGRKPADIAADLDAMIALRQQADNTTVIGVLPVNPHGRLGRRVENEMIKSLNQTLRETCERQKNCRFADPQSMPFGFTAPLAPEYDSGDGVHLNAAGNMRLGRFIETTIATTAQ